MNIRRVCGFAGVSYMSDDEIGAAIARHASSVLYIIHRVSLAWAAVRTVQILLAIVAAASFTGMLVAQFVDGDEGSRLYLRETAMFLSSIAGFVITTLVINSAALYGREVDERAPSEITEKEKVLNSSLISINSNDSIEPVRSLAFKTLAYGSLRMRAAKTVPEDGRQVMIGWWIK